MINLIPNQEKKKKGKDFYFRLGVVFLAAIGFCVLVAILSILPSYFLSSVEKNLAYEKLEIQKREPVPAVDQDSLKTVEDLNEKILLINASEKNTYLVSQKIISEIILKKMPDIKINRINYENNSVTGKEISINGVAPSRGRLLLFRRALEDDVAFKKVDLPVSNFIKGSNIEFYLKLIPRSNDEGGQAS
ncbi:hypothetical protein HYW73_00335 [Candidatus Nomurabacteria bacterium]|nr:hypothetical protein [Candidatus Nomurabacteria bacterium]